MSLLWDPCPMHPSARARRVEASVSGGAGPFTGLQAGDSWPQSPSSSSRRENLRHLQP